MVGCGRTAARSDLPDLLDAQGSLRESAGGGLIGASRLDRGRVQIGPARSGRLFWDGAMRGCVAVTAVAERCGRGRGAGGGGGGQAGPPPVSATMTFFPGGGLRKPIPVSSFRSPAR